MNLILGRAGCYTIAQRQGGIVPTMRQRPESQRHTRSGVIGSERIVTP